MREEEVIEQLQKRKSRLEAKFARSKGRGERQRTTDLHEKSIKRINQRIRTAEMRLKERA